MQGEEGVSRVTDGEGSRGGAAVTNHCKHILPAGCKESACMNQGKI